MKVNKIPTSNIMVTRVYKTTKFKRNLAAVGAVVNLALGVNDAVSHRLPNMLVSYGCTCLMAKLTKNCQDVVSLLKPEYKSIIKRARSIYKHK